MIGSFLIYSWGPRGTAARLWLTLAPIWLPLGCLGVPLGVIWTPWAALGRFQGQARARERLNRFWGRSERSSTVNSNKNQPFRTQPPIPRIPRISGIPRKRCQELRLGTPLPRAPGVRMTGVHKLPQTTHTNQKTPKFPKMRTRFKFKI